MLGPLTSVSLTFLHQDCLKPLLNREAVFDAGRWYHTCMKQFIYAVVLIFLPAISFAQLGTIDTFFNKIIGFINNILIPLIFGLALLVFIYGVYKYFILGGSNEEEQKKGKQLVLWAVIGFVLMVSIWGIVNIIAGGLFPDTQPPILPAADLSSQ